ncbi:hypothetical protein ACLMJK_000421 [Lecanora helva]
MDSQSCHPIYNLIDTLDVHQLTRFNAFVSDHPGSTNDKILSLWVAQDLDGAEKYRELLEKAANQLVGFEEEHDADDENDRESELEEEDADGWEEREDVSHFMEEQKLQRQQTPSEEKLREASEELDWGLESSGTPSDASEQSGCFQPDEAIRVHRAGSREPPTNTSSSD